MTTNAGASIRRGEIYLVDWSPSRGSEQSGRRPAVIVQADAANLHSGYPNTIVVAVSRSGRSVPFHVRIPATVKNGLTSDPSYVKCEQVMTISKERLQQYLGDLEPEDLKRVSAALKKTMELT